MDMDDSIYCTCYGSGRAYNVEVENLYRQWTGKALHNFVTTNEHLLLAKTRTGRAVGAALLIVIPDIVQGRYWGLVENVFVLSEYRGQHVGKKLMKAVELQALGTGCSFIKLTSRKPAGQALYRSLGYREGLSFYQDTTEQALKERQSLQPSQEVIVCVSGYFDPMHGGHLDHIEEAGLLGDRLIVIAGTEEQCDHKLEHEGKHFLSWKEKVRMLLKMGAHSVVPNVDKDGTCAATLTLVKPDIFAKGEGFTLNNIPRKEIDACRDIGCEIRVGVGARLNESRIYWLGEKEISRE